MLEHQIKDDGISKMYPDACVARNIDRDDLFRCNNFISSPTGYCGMATTLEAWSR